MVTQVESIESSASITSSAPYAGDASAILVTPGTNFLSAFFL